MATEMVCSSCARVKTIIIKIKNNDIVFAIVMGGQELQGAQRWRVQFCVWKENLQVFGHFVSFSW